MARRVFFSFAWDDVWRVNQVRNCGVSFGVEITGFRDAAEIEQVKKQTDEAIRGWIDDQLYGTSVTAVLIGANTCSSRWVDYEISESKRRGNGLLGIDISGIKDQRGWTSYRCEPILTGYDVYYWDPVSSPYNIGRWIEEAAQLAGR